MPRLRRRSRTEPGWTRRRSGRGFVYLDQHGDRLAEADAQRVKDLVIPPAWQDVWICTYPNGHLQAVGKDDAGRWQYLYHPDWRVKRDSEKHLRVLGFGRRLPRIRERVTADLLTGEASMAFGCATAVRLLDRGYFRIGSDAYADNDSFGLTTLEKRHVRKSGSGLVFAFVGKSGVSHRVEIDDPAVIEALEVMRRRRGGGDRLLAFKDGRRWRALDAETVNGYIGEVSGAEATAKDFRTWHATVHAAAALAAAEAAKAAETKTARKRAVAAAMREVAEYLGNTPAMARSSYVDPRVVDAYEEGRTIIAAVRRAYDDEDLRQAGLERALLRLLK